MQASFDKTIPMMVDLLDHINGPAGLFRHYAPREVATGMKAGRTEPGKPNITQAIFCRVVQMS